MSPILAPPPYPISPDELRPAPARASMENADRSAPDSGAEQSFSFSDFLSIINPLQHLPIIGTIYRAVTGDTIKPAPRVIGGLLFGGPAGLIASAFNAMVEQTKGKDLSDQMLAMVMPDKTGPAPTEPAPQFAEATPPQPQPSSQPAADDTGIAPLSRGLFGFTPHQNPTPADRALAGSQRVQPHGSTAAQGRTLADYRSFSGRPLPTVDATRSGSTSSTPVRLQPTAPMPEKPRTSAAPEAKEQGTREAVPADNATSAQVEAGSSANPAPPSDWFAAAMSRGLDRYREQRRTAPAATQIDATL